MTKLSPVHWRLHRTQRELGFEAHEGYSGSQYTFRTLGYLVRVDRQHVVHCEDGYAITPNEVRRGETDTRSANAIGCLSGVLLKAMEDSNLAEQVAELKAMVEEMKRGPGVPESTSSEAPGGSRGGNGAADAAGGPRPRGPVLDHDARQDAAGPVAGPDVAHFG